METLGDQRVYKNAVPIMVQPGDAFVQIVVSW